MSGKPALEVKNLVKHYGGVQAVRGVSFTVPTGSIVGLIGPNGAGKTTTFNVVAGSERPTRIAARGNRVGDRKLDRPFRRGPRGIGTGRGAPGPSPAVSPWSGHRLRPRPGPRLVARLAAGNIFRPNAYEGTTPI